MLPTIAAICVAARPPTEPYAGEPPRLSRPAPVIPRHGRSPAAFAPPGWRVERAITGDLNGDGRPDLAAVVRGSDPRCIVQADTPAGTLDTNPRAVLVALGTASGYALQAVNAHIIPRMDDPYADDPLTTDAFEIRDGVLRLGLNHWRSMGGWTTFSATFTFRWDGHRMRLIGYDRESLQRNSGETETISVNYLTGRAKQVTGSMEDDVDDTTTWHRVASSSAVFDTVGNGLEFTPTLSGKR